jgi:hypothetical protein
VSAFGLIGILIFVFRIMNRAEGKRLATPTATQWRRIVWGTCVGVWGLGWLFVLFPAWGFALSATGGSVGGLVVAIAFSLAFAVSGVALFSPWPVLYALARRGHARLVCALAHASFAFFRSGETASGATLLAAVALAHRGVSTPAERAWLEARLRKSTRFLGTFAVAHAFACALEARALRDDGNANEVRQWEETARILLGTVTYLSSAGVPEPVRRLAYEYLALDAAREGLWGGVHVPPGLHPAKVHRVLHEWASERFFPTTERKAQGPFRAISPLAVALASRPLEPRLIENARDAHLRASRVYVALSRREPVPARDVLNMLMAFDLLTYPEAPDCILPAEIKADDAQTSAVHEELATAIADALSSCDAPLYALPRYGPVSARVHQKVETALSAEWARMMKQVEARRASYERLDGYGEWLEASRVRRLYRRIEYTLGEPAVARLWGQFVYAYCFLGVRLSETLPRMRPLAHAVFAVLAKEAERFGDVENVARQLSNMKITSGVE